MIFDEIKYVKYFKNPMTWFYVYNRQFAILGGNLQIKREVTETSNIKIIY